MAELTARHPALEAVVPDLMRAFHELSRCFKTGGVLYLCGNGGSMSDALHISGELLKSYARRRRCRIVCTLASSSSRMANAWRVILNQGCAWSYWVPIRRLSSAVANDMPDRDVNFAQELLALARPGDVLLGISTSGNARNVSYAAQVAHALNLPVIALTGKDGGNLATLADVADPGTSAAHGSRSRTAHPVLSRLVRAAGKHIFR